MQSIPRVYKSGDVVTTTPGYFYKLQPLNALIESYQVKDVQTGQNITIEGGGFTAYGLSCSVTGGSFLCSKTFSKAPVSSGGGGGNSYIPNVVEEYSGSYTGEAITIPNGKILALSGLNGLALADLSGLTPESLGDGVYSTGECYIPAMATPPTFSWATSLLWIEGQAATGKAPTIAASTAYRLALRKEGLQIFANLTYYNEL